jgi:hypothetical protein
LGCVALVAVFCYAVSTKVLTASTTMWSEK